MVPKDRSESVVGCFLKNIRNPFFTIGKPIIRIAVENKNCRKKRWQIIEYGSAIFVKPIIIFWPKPNSNSGINTIITIVVKRP